MPSKSEEYLKDYVNYLEKRVNLLTKSFNPVVPIKKDRRPTPEEVKLRVLQNARFNNFLDKISSNKSDREKKIHEALQILSEMGFDRSYTVLRSLGTVLDVVFARVFSAVYINEKNLRELKSSMGQHQVLYLPSHRSYADFCLMSFVCFCYNLEIPCIAAGMDFHGMMGLGELLRQTGAFFMRRTFGDEFYWNIFKEYVHEIITFNDLGLEFFVEGTRSRTAKALYPKTGLLSMALEPFFMGELYDLKVVPISISYEKPLEEQLFVYELLGIPKPKESTKGFFKAISALKNKKYGRLFFDFGKPIHLNEYFYKKLDKFQHASTPAHVQKLTENELHLTEELANHVVREQQKKIVIFVFNLMALIYNEHIFTSSANGLSMNEMKRKILMLAELFEALGAIVNITRDNLTQDILSTIAVHDNILEVKGKNSIFKLKKTKTDIARASKDNVKVKGHYMCSQVMDIAVPVFSLQLYCNPTLFWLAEPAFFVLCTIAATSEVAIKDLKNQVKGLREMFIYEFVMYPGNEDEDFEKTLTTLTQLDVLQNNSSDSVRLNEKSPYISHFLSAISPFLSCYLYTCTVILSSFREKKFYARDIFIAVQSSLEQEILIGCYSIHPYSLCLEAITTTMLSLCNNECLKKEKFDSVNQYSVNVEHLKSLIDKLNNYNSKLTFEYKYFDAAAIASKM